MARENVMAAAYRAVAEEAGHVVACLLTGTEYQLPSKRHRPTTDLPDSPCRECGEVWPCTWRRSYESLKRDR